jgi:hypothetical protein
MAFCYLCLGFKTDQHEVKKKFASSFNSKSVFYGCETWRTTDNAAIDSEIRQHLSEAHLQHQMTYKIRRLVTQEPVAEQILRRKWSWNGHTLRKPEASTTRHDLTWNPLGKRKRGRPCKSWKRDSETKIGVQGVN